MGPLAATEEAEGARRPAHVQQAEADFDPIPFDGPAARAFGIVASAYRRSGRKPAARAFDALIAATAMANGLPLCTPNPADFAGIDGLVVRTVPASSDLRAPGVDVHRDRVWWRASRYLTGSVCTTPQVTGVLAAPWPSG